MGDQNGKTGRVAISRSDRERLAATWTKTWPGSRPIADELRNRFPDRWVRFHSLPESKRSPDTEAEYDILLGRHHAILRELAGPAYGTTDALVVTVSASGSERPTRRGSAVVGVAPHATHWGSFLTDDSDPTWLTWQHAYLNRLPLCPDSLDPLLRVVADDHTWGVIIALDGLDWLYHPYDGGADVLLPSSGQRDLLSAAHRDWLSSHPLGL